MFTSLRKQSLECLSVLRSAKIPTLPFTMEGNSLTLKTLRISSLLQGYKMLQQGSYKIYALRRVAIHAAAQHSLINDSA